MSSNETMGAMNPVPRGRREALILLTLLAVTAAALTAVGALVRRFRSWQDALGHRMNERGQLTLKEGQPSQAIQLFRSALAFNRDDSAALLNLAESLMAENRLDEAESYFHTLWDRQPEDGTVNLELARLAARRHQLTPALRYYHNAIYGIWGSDPIGNRISARFELINFLLQQNSVTQAESELIAMEPGLPAESQLHARVGQLFLRIPDYRNAEGEFLQALKLDRNNETAAAGAGKAAFRLGHYRTAVLYLDAALAKAPHDQSTRDMLDTARQVLETDPFLRNLSALERQERTLKAYRAAAKRLEDCMKDQGETARVADAANQGGTSAMAALQDLSRRERQLRSQMRPGRLSRNPELPAAAMSFVFEVEEETTQACGEPSAIDQALLLIGRNREGVER